jgi:predicted CXXCH cytochrome family protein
MRKWLAISAMLAVGLTFGLAPAFGASMVGAPHDLSGNGYGTDQICIFCHTPHNTKIAELDIKLWNHETTTATYQLYGGGTTSVGTTVGEPGKNSKTCLSCHDGSIAINAFGAGHSIQGAADRFMGVEYPANLTGTDLRDDHPVGVALTVGPGYKIPTGGSSGGMKLYDNKVECSSCHGVHSSSIPKYLKLDNTGSALCLNCHIK